MSVAPGASPSPAPKPQPSQPQGNPYSSLFSTAVSKITPKNVAKGAIFATNMTTIPGQVSNAYNAVTGVMRKNQATVPSAPKLAQAQSAALLRPRTPQNTPVQDPSQAAGAKKPITMDDIFGMSEKFNNDSAGRWNESARKNNDERVGAIRGSYDRANQALKDQMPFLQDQHERTKAELLAAADDIRKSGVIEADAANETYGEALRSGAQMNREENARIKNQMAMLGTFDSSQTRDRLINQSETFQSGQQKTLREKARELSRIEATVQTAERTAKNAVANEVANFQETVRKINEAVNMNDAEKESEIRKAYGELEMTVNGIQDYLEKSKYELNVAKMQFQMEQQGKTPFSGLSEQFMATGEPTNAQEDYILKSAEQTAWNIANGYMKLEEVTDPTVRALTMQYLTESGSTAPGGKGASAAEKSQTGKAQAGISALQQIESMIGDNSWITSQNSLPGSPGARQYEAAVSSLTDAIGGLRTGASVSKEQQAFYRNLLPKVGDSPETRAYKINALRNELQGYM